MMYMKVLPIGEARRRLPELVRSLARGGQPPITIGRRGKPEAILTSAVPERRPEKKPLRGLIELLSDWEDVGQTESELREERARSVLRTEREIEEEPPKPRRAKRRR